MNKKVNYLTALRDRFAGSFKRAAINIVGIVALGHIIWWVLVSVAAKTPAFPFSFESVLYSFTGVMIVVIAAHIVKWRWPPENNG